MPTPRRPSRQDSRQQSRQASMDPRNEIMLQMDHYIGVDVGTGSARACIINDKGDIVGLASENIGLWQPEQGYYVSRRHLSLSCSMPPCSNAASYNITKLQCLSFVLCIFLFSSHDIRKKTFASTPVFIFVHEHPMALKSSLWERKLTGNIIPGTINYRYLALYLYNRPESAQPTQHQSPFDQGYRF